MPFWSVMTGLGRTSLILVTRIIIYIVVVSLLMGWDWPTACMVTPLGCKNVLSPSNQVSVLINCASHKQISESYPFCCSFYCQDIMSDQTQLLSDINHIWAANVECYICLCRVFMGMCIYLPIYRLKHLYFYFINFSLNMLVNCN